MTSFLILVFFNGSKASSMCMILPNLVVPAWDVPWPTLTTAAFYVETSAISLSPSPFTSWKLNCGVLLFSTFPTVQKRARRVSSMAPISLTIIALFKTHALVAKHPNDLLFFLCKLYILFFFLLHLHKSFQ